MLDHDVGAGEQLGELPAMGRVAGVEHHAALADVAAEERDAATRRARRVDVGVARPRVGTARRLDEPHLGTEAGEGHARILGEAMGDLDDDHAVQQAQTGGAVRRAHGMIPWRKPTRGSPARIASSTRATRARVSFGSITSSIWNDSAGAKLSL